MSRMVKCKICGKQIPQAEAYKVTITKDDGKKINKYYCDSIELESYEQDILKNKQDKEIHYQTNLNSYQKHNANWQSIQ